MLLSIGGGTKKPNFFLIVHLTHFLIAGSPEGILVNHKVSLNYWYQKTTRKCLQSTSPMYMYTSTKGMIIYNVGRRMEIKGWRDEKNELRVWEGEGRGKGRGGRKEGDAWGMRWERDAWAWGGRGSMWGGTVTTAALAAQLLYFSLKTSCRSGKPMINLVWEWD